MVRVTAEAREATRERLLVAAAGEFGRVGFERASVDEISLAAGFAKGTIYNYFRSKEELFLAVVEGASQQAAASTAAPADASARERLRLLLGGFCAWAREHEPFARVLVRECLMGTPGLYDRVIAAESPLLAELEAVLRDGAEEGELRADLPAELLAQGLAGLTDLALAQHWASGGKAPALTEIPELVLQVVLGPVAGGR